MTMTPATRELVRKVKADVASGAGLTAPVRELIRGWMGAPPHTAADVERVARWMRDNLHLGASIGEVRQWIYNSIAGTNPVTAEDRTPPGYRHERLEDPSAFDPRSLRTIEAGGGDRLVIGCPRGHYDAKRRRCKVGTRAQAILHAHGEANPCPGRSAIENTPGMGPAAMPNPDPAAATFEAWHEFPPDRVITLPVPPVDGERMVMLGHLRRIDYDSVKWSKRPPGRRPRRTYYHESTGRPVIVTNPQGTVLVIWDPSGKLRVTPDGIKG